MKKGYTHITLLIDSSGSMEVIRDATITNYNKFIEEQKSVKGKCTISHYEFSSGSTKQVKNSRTTRHLVTYLPAKVNTNDWMSKQLWNVGQQGCVQPAGWGWNGFNNQVPTSEFSCVENFVDIEKAQVLNREIFVPHHWTPLLDSIGRAIYETGEHLSGLKVNQRPEKVLFVIITDGAENASVEYSKDDIKAVIEHQKNTYNWDFIFLGANIDAVSVGTSYGIGGASSVNFAATAASVGGSTHTLSEKVALYRTTADIGASKAFLNYSDADRTASLGGDPNYVSPPTADANTTSKVSSTG